MTGSRARAAWVAAFPMLVAVSCGGGGQGPGQPDADSGMDTVGTTGDRPDGGSSDVEASAGPPREDASQAHDGPASGDASGDAPVGAAADAPADAAADAPNAADAGADAPGPSTVGGASGGVVSDGQMVTLEIPPGALAGETHFSFTPMALAGLPGGISAIPGAAVRVEWTGAGFTANAEITASIQPAPVVMDGFAAAGEDPPPGFAVFECPNGTLIYYPETQVSAGAAAGGGSGTGKWTVGHLGPNDCNSAPSAGGGGSGAMELGIVDAGSAANSIPVITVHPSSLTRTVPAAATFSGAADGATGYQWRRDGAVIPGATSAVYTLATTAPSDSGAIFSFMASNTYGGVISRRAVLTANGCSGACQCSAAQLECASSCVNPLTNRNHCGTCDVACPWACAGGACVAPGGIAVGAQHTCVRESSGDVYCWGLDDAQLGIINGVVQNQSHPVRLEGVSGAVQVGAGNEHTCVLLASGQVSCLGVNDWGQAGDGTRNRRYEPAIVPGLRNVVQIGAGIYFTCALLDSGEVACWGDWGYTNHPPHLAPVTMAGLTDAVQISVGNSHACALRQTGEVACWGSNIGWQLGDGNGSINEEEKLDPVAVLGVDDAVQVSAGASQTCARRATGDVVCWGSWFAADGSATIWKSPTVIPGLANAVDINATGATGVDLRTNMGTVICGLMSTGDVLCMGDNHYGLVGDGTTTNRSDPVPVSGVTDAVEIAHGGDSGHMCARRRSGQIVCWGFNQYGELGNGQSFTGSNAVYVDAPADVLPP